MTLWMGDARLLDKKGNPTPLPRLKKNAADGKNSSFEELFELVTKSIKPRAFLDECIHNGAVSINENDEVCFELNSFVTSKSFEEKTFYLGKNIHDHLAAARANVNSDEPPFFERSVYYYDLSEDSVEELSRLSREKGMEALKYVNSKANRLQKRDVQAKNTSKQMHVGIYFFSDEDDRVK